MEMSAGKLRHMRRLADENGRFKMIAVDQRPPMLKALAPKLAPRAPGYTDLSLAKASLAKKLLSHGTAILIDPDYGYSAAERYIGPDKGLLVTLENFAFEETPQGRKTAAMKGWDVGKIKRMGADGVKLLLWYRHDASAEVLDHQRGLVRQVGAACAQYDIPFLLELLVFPFMGSAGHTTDYTEDKSKYPELVLQSLSDFSSPEFGVDIYKIESPVVADVLPDPEADTAESREAQDRFNQIGTIIDKPWVMLSAGSSMEVFRRVLQFAYRAGASGYLAGRAIWWPSFEAYPDVEEMERQLDRSATDYMAQINKLTNAGARPWTAAPAIGGNPALKHAGHEFPAEYPGM